VEWNEAGTNFTHWPILTADWAGDWNGSEYLNYNYAHFKWSMDQMEAMLARWGAHSAVIGFEPINEPGGSTPLDYLKDYYRRVRKLVERYAPQAYFVFHDSFRFSWDTWKDLFPANDWKMVAVDHHGYLAWGNYDSIDEACDDFTNGAKEGKNFRDAGCEVWWGEWALATDNCAHWLGGFNDANPNPQ